MIRAPKNKSASFTTGLLQHLHGNVTALTVAHEYEIDLGVVEPLLQYVCRRIESTARTHILWPDERGGTCTLTGGYCRRIGIGHYRNERIVGIKKPRKGMVPNSKSTCVDR